jgi:hypothetical protein
MTAQSKDTNAPHDPNLARPKSELEKTADAFSRITDTANSISDTLLRRTKKQVLELQIQRAAYEVRILEQDASVLRDATGVQQRLADKRRELADLRAQLKREFPETERRWWHALLFWRKS